MSKYDVVEKGLSKALKGFPGELSLPDAQRALRFAMLHMSVGILSRHALAVHGFKNPGAKFDPNSTVRKIGPYCTPPDTAVSLASCVLGLPTEDSDPGTPPK